VKSHGVLGSVKKSASNAITEESKKLKNNIASARNAASRAKDTGNKAIAKIKAGVSKVSNAATKVSDKINDKLGRLNSKQRAQKKQMIAEKTLGRKGRVCFTKRDGISLYRRGKCTRVHKGKQVCRRLSKRSGVFIFKRCEGYDVDYDETIHEIEGNDEDEGSFSDVYEGIKQDTGQKVAIKVATGDGVDRSFAEAEILKVFLSYLTSVECSRARGHQACRSGEA
jgi:hypothetical protein